MFLPSKGLQGVERQSSPRPYTERKVYLATISDGVASSVDIAFSILNPSVRLDLSLWFYWEPVTLPVVLPSAPTVTIEQTIVPPFSSTSESVVGTLLTATAVPLLTEIRGSMSSRYRGTLATGTLAAGNFGSWVCLARWEPNAEISEGELSRLFASCDVSLQGALRVL